MPNESLNNQSANKQSQTPSGLGDALNSLKNKFTGQSKKGPYLPFGSYLPEHRSTSAGGDTVDLGSYAAAQQEMARAHDAAQSRQTSKLSLSALSTMFKGKGSSSGAK